MTNIASVISHVTVDEYRLQEPSTEVALATHTGMESTSDYDDVAVNDDGDDIDFPPPGAISFQISCCY